MLRRGSWPSPLFSNPVPGEPTGSFTSRLLIPYVVYAYHIQENYILANRAIILLASWLRTLNEAEWIYMESVFMKRYTLE